MPPIYEVTVFSEEDADVMHHCMNDISKPVKEKEQKRYENLCREFGLS